MKILISIFTILAFMLSCKSGQLTTDESTSSAAKTALELGKENTEKRDNSLVNQGIDFVAMGNEPGWQFRFDQDSRTAELAFVGRPVLTLTQKEPQDQSLEKMIFEAEGHQIIVNTELVQCFDPMSGESFTHRVTIDMNSVTYEGCGKKMNEFIQAEPIDPKLFNTWIITSWEGKELAPNARPNITFDGKKNAVSGFASCNRFTGSFFVGGSHMTFKPMAMTKMFCEGSIETQFMDLLMKTQQFSIEKDKLLLSDWDGKLLLTFEMSKD